MFESIEKVQRKAIYTSEDADSLIVKGHEWNFHDSDTQEHLHSLHTYPAKFIPQIPRKAIEEWTSMGDVVYDPFCGCGTTLLEASLLGRPSIGTDNNAVAILVSRAKTANYVQTDLDYLKEFAVRLDKSLSRQKPRKDLIPSNENFLYWFNKSILERLSALKSLILKAPEPSQALLLSIFSSIVVRVSYQDSDTRYAKIKRAVKQDDVSKLFKSKLIDITKRLPEIMLEGRSPVAIYQADSRRVPFIKADSISLIVTSPPYLNAYDYHKYHRQRLHWIEGDIEFARDLEIGSHDEFTRPRATADKYFEDMDACFTEWGRVLRKKGKCVVIVGDAIVNKKPVPVADRFIDLLNQHNVKMKKRWIRTLHKTKRAFNVRNSRISHEHVLLFEKK
jgi:DNA modification methylase